MVSEHDHILQVPTMITSHCKLYTRIDLLVTVLRWQYIGIVIVCNYCNADIGILHQLA